MTEPEWLGATDPAPMLEFLKGKASDRKLRLFGVGCCRRKWKYLADRLFEEAVAVAEVFADDADAVGAVDFARWNAGVALARWRRREGSAGVHVRAGDAAVRVTYTPPSVAHIALRTSGVPVNSAAARAREAGEQAALVRDIFGNPFRPVAIDPGWLTSTVLALAEGAYAERAFDRLPILADALQDAGCEDAAVLDHCRGEGSHSRGCWVVDLVLGKS